MRPSRQSTSLRCLGTAMLLIGIASTGCGTGSVVDGTDDDPPDQEDVCIQLAEETVLIAQQLVDIAEETGDINVELACRFLANEIELLDEGCITEADLPEGTSRASLLTEQEDLNCPVN